jgi:hypothetical protein
VPRDRRLERETLVRGAFLAAAAVAFAIRLADAIRSQAATQGAFGDWLVYSNAVGRWLAGGPIYLPEQLHGPYLSQWVGRIYLYPPASVPMFLPIAVGDVGLVIWEAFLIATFFTGVWLIVSRGFPRRQIEAFGVVLLASAFYYPLTQGIAAGNVNIVTAGLLGLAWAGVPRLPAIAGAFGVVKIFPAVIAVLYGRRGALTAALTGFAIVAITLPMIGTDAWAAYFQAMRDGQPVCETWILSPSFACTLEPVLTLRGAELLSIFIAAALVATGAWLGPTLLGTTAVAAAIMVPSIDLHLHYWTFVAILLLIAVARVARRRRGEAPDPAWRPFRERWGLRTV